MTGPAPALAGIKALFVADLAARTGITVHEHATPADVDVTAPWLVVHWIPGGGQHGPAAKRSDLWTLRVQVTAVAHSPDGRAPIPAAIHYAAQWAADKARQTLTAPTTGLVDGDGNRVVAVQLVAQGGEDPEGPTVNIADQWAITVHHG